MPSAARRVVLAPDGHRGAAVLHTPEAQGTGVVLEASIADPAQPRAGPVEAHQIPFAVGVEPRAALALPRWVCADSGELSKGQGAREIGDEVAFLR